MRKGGTLKYEIFIERIKMMKIIMLIDLIIIIIKKGLNLVDDTA